MERHTLLRHKIQVSNNTPSNNTSKFNENANNLSQNSNSLSNTPNRTRSSHIQSNTSINNNNLSQNNATPNDDSFRNINKFQCDKCPCKYKRSSDLTKHLRIKHGIFTNVHEYLRKQQQNQQQNNSQINTNNDEFYNENDEDDLEDQEDTFNNSKQSPPQPQNTNIRPNSSNNNNNSNVIMANRNFNQIQRRSINELASHASTSSKSTSLECPYCTYFSNGNDSEYITHVKEHLCGKAFRCVLCNSVYKYRGDCVVHLKRKHQKADMVAHSYVDRFDLEKIELNQICAYLKPKQHEDLENEEKLFGCAYCDYKANYKGDVFKHQTRRHPGNAKSVLALASNVNGNNNTSRANYSNMMNESGGENNSYMNGDNYEDDEEDDNFFHGENNNDVIDINDEEQDEPINDIMDEEEDFFNERSHLNNNSQDENNEDDDIIDDNNPDQYEDYNNDKSQNVSSQQQESLSNKYQCKFCPFVGKNGAKLQLHLATHYNIKQYMCPVCNRRANFKWDIQKHLRKIHNNYELDVIILPEAEARKSINSYIQHNSSTTNNAISNNRHQVVNNVSHTTHSPNFKFANRHAVREKKFKCSLCMRTSKWQWDIKKHIRTVHKNKSGDVIVLNSKEIATMNNSMNENGNQFQTKQSLNQSLPASFNNNNQNSTNRVISNSLFRNSIINMKSQSSTPTAASVVANGSVQAIQSSNPSLTCNSIGSDSTGNKKFKCTFCVYRSNWKADIFRHARKRHFVANPGQQHVIILSADVAANTLDEYERLHGVNIRKRSRIDMDSTSIQYSPMTADSTTNNNNNNNNLQNKRIKTDLSSVASTATTLSTLQSSNYNDEPNGYMDEQNDDFGDENYDSNYEDENNTFTYNNQNNNMDDLQNEDQEIIAEDEHEDTVERLPVKASELNVKPYKCLKCGFRSDRKSDTLRHIRTKHAVLQPFNFLRILSIQEASRTIDHYLATRGSNTNKRSSRNSGEYSSSPTMAIPTNNITNNNLNNSINNNNTNNNIRSINNVTSTIINQNNNNNNNNNNHRVNNINNNMNQNTRINSNISTAITNTNETSRNMNGKCEKESQVSIEYYKCPFCFYKHMNKLVMRKHLAFHFNVNKKVIPHFKCSLCKFKSLWQHTVKNHCMKSHLGSSNVKVLRITNSNHFNSDYSIDRSNEEEIENNCNTNNNNNNTSANNATSYTNTNNNNNNANSTNMKNNIQINGNNLNGYHDEHDNEQDLDNNDDDVQNENRMNHTIHDLASFNNSISNNHEDGEDKREESIILTGFDGVKFAATYLVSASSAATNNTSLNLNSLINTNKKKMYYCQTCPYKTSNNCNLKQHLVQHRYHEGFFKCRYCTYYVSMVRLLKQHEILHPEFEPRDSGKQPTKSSSSNLLNNNYASTIVVSNGIKNEFE